MTTTREDGGPAFPLNDLSHNQATGEAVVHQYIYSGMTLRDYFAAQALSLAREAELRHQQHFCDPEAECTVSDEAVAKRAYRTADAMLKARNA